MEAFDENGWIKSDKFTELCDKVGELIVEGLEGYSSLECMIAAKYLVTEVSFRCSVVGVEAYTKSLEKDKDVEV